MDSKSSYDPTAFVLASNGKLDELRLFLQDHPEKLDEPNPTASNALNVNKTLMHAAAENGHPEIIEFLLASGSQAITMKTKLGSIPLHFAAQRGHLSSVEVLLKAGKDLPLEDYIDLQNDEYLTPLHYAARHHPISNHYYPDHINILKLLLAAGSKSYLAVTNDGSTLLHTTPNPETLNILCQHVPNLEAVKNRIGHTPMHHHVTVGRIEMVEVLDRHGHRINARGPDGSVPMHYAVVNRHMDHVRILHQIGLKQGLSVEQIFDVQNERGHTLLHAAAWKLLPEFIEFILGLETSGLLAQQIFSKADRDGGLPVHFAAKEGSLSALQALLGPSVIPSTHRYSAMIATTKESKTPLWYAMDYDREDIIKWLMKHGAGSGYTASLYGWHGLKELIHALGYEVIASTSKVKVEVDEVKRIRQEIYFDLSLTYRLVFWMD